MDIIQELSLRTSISQTDLELVLEGNRLPYIKPLDKESVLATKACLADEITARMEIFSKTVVNSTSAKMFRGYSESLSREIDPDLQRLLVKWQEVLQEEEEIPWREKSLAEVTEAEGTQELIEGFFNAPQGWCEAKILAIQKLDKIYN